MNKKILLPKNFSGIRNKKNIALFLAVIYILIIIPCVRSYGPDLVLKWESDIDGVLKETYSEDMDNDGSFEFIFVSSTGIYVIDSKGHLVWEYNLDNIRAVSIADINNDQYNEIVVSSGDIAEEIARCWIIALDRNGKVLWKFPPSKVGSTTLMRDIQAVDIDDNKYYEIIGASTYGISAIKDTYDEFLWYRKISERIEGVKIADFAAGTQYIAANSFPRFYLLDLNGTILWSYNISNSIKTVDIANVYGGGGKDILITSGNDRIYVISSNGTLEFETVIVEDVGITATADFNTLYERVLVGSHGTVYALSPKFQVDWSYRTGKEITGIYATDLNEDGKNEILIVAGDKLYELEENGNFLWRYGFDNNVNKFILKDIDNDNYDEFIVNSGGRVYAFSINRTYINKQNADSNYELAYTYFNSEDYENAIVYLNNAVLLYSKIEDMENVIKCRLLFLKMGTDPRTNKIRLADIYYKNAERYYNSSDYENAGKYVGRAIEIYREINDDNNLSKSEELLLKIENATKNAEITTTTTSAEITTTSMSAEIPKQDYAGSILFVIQISLVILLILFILKIKSRK